MCNGLLSRRSRLVAFMFLAAAPLMATYSQAAQIIFHSKFESATALGTPQDCTVNSPYLCWQTISGTDASTGYTWPPQVWGSQSAYGAGTVFQLISHVPGITASTIGNYLSNRIVNVEGYSGNLTNKAIYSEINLGPVGQNPIGTSATQNVLQIFPTSGTQDELYFSFWIRFQPGLVANMTGLDSSFGSIYGNGGTWRSFFEVKTGTLATSGEFPGNDGDYRIAAYIVTGCRADLISEQIAPCTGSNPNPAPFWLIEGDNLAGGSHDLTNAWKRTNTTVAIPDDGSWNRVQVFLRRSDGATGRFWMAINGTPIVDRSGANTGELEMPINRIMPGVLYTGGRLPAYQWMDDIEIWLGMPQ